MTIFPDACYLATLTGASSLLDKEYFVGSALISDTFLAFSATPAGCSISYSMELLDINSNSWKPLTDYTLINNILFTFNSVSRQISVGLTSDNSFARSAAYQLRMKAFITNGINFDYSTVNVNVRD